MLAPVSPARSQRDIALIIELMAASVADEIIGKIRKFERRSRTIKARNVRRVKAKISGPLARAVECVSKPLVPGSISLILDADPAIAIATMCIRVGDRRLEYGLPRGATAR